MTEPVFLIGLLIAGATAVMIVKTIAAAFTSGKTTTDATQLRDELYDAQRSLEEARNRLDQQGAQLAELQERMDFAERMLAQARDRAALKPGDQPS